MKTLKIVELITSSVGVSISVAKALNVQPKIVNNPREIVAELLSLQNKRSMFENVKKITFDRNSC